MFSAWRQKKVTGNFVKDKATCKIVLMSCAKYKDIKKTVTFLTVQGVRRSKVTTNSADKKGNLSFKGFFVMSPPG